VVLIEVVDWRQLLTLIAASENFIINGTRRECGKLLMTDDEFLAQFESTTFPFEQWHHRQHIKAAYLYLRAHPFERAVEQMRTGIKAYNQQHQSKSKTQAGYHETMTQGWMRLVYLTLCEFGPAETSDAFVDQHTQLLSPRALFLFYSPERLMSAQAKEQFVQPDLGPFPRSKKDGEVSFAESADRRL
jgi:hypothetical protein